MSRTVPMLADALRGETFTADEWAEEALIETAEIILSQPHQAQRRLEFLHHGLQSWEFLHEIERRDQLQAMWWEIDLLETPDLVDDVLDRLGESAKAEVARRISEKAHPYSLRVEEVEIPDGATSWRCSACGGEQAASVIGVSIVTVHETTPITYCGDCVHLAAAALGESDT